MVKAIIVVMTNGDSHDGDDDYVIEISVTMSTVRAMIMMIAMMVVITMAIIAMMCKTRWLWWWWL